MKGVIMRRYCAAAPVQRKIALLSDLHGRHIPGLAEEIAREKPDVICLAGDMLEYKKPYDGSAGLAFLQRLPQIAPTLYATGNHESLMPGRQKRALAHAGLRFVDDVCLQIGDIWFAGLSTGGGASVVGRLARKPGFRVLLCHHPEYYEPLVKDFPVDLILSGHAHGGQWQLFGRGLYAPGQGLFPRYTGGIYDGRLIVSRGLSNTTCIPRLGNPREWVTICLGENGI